jgi:hypothetical protein
MTVAEHFRDLDINDVESAVRVLTMCHYPSDIFKDWDYVAQFIDGDEQQVDWYMDEYHTGIEETPIYDHWTKLLSICADLIKEFAEQEYRGPATNAMIMDMAMKRLRKQHGLNAPEPWLPTIRELRNW